MWDMTLSLHPYPCKMDREGTEAYPEQTSCTGPLQTEFIWVFEQN